MKIKLEFRKNGTDLYHGVHEIECAEDFGRAFAVAWQELHRVQLGRESSVGAHMNENVLSRSTCGIGIFSMRLNARTRAPSGRKRACLSRLPLSVFSSLPHQCGGA
jgi:hypothetical protein